MVLKKNIEIQLLADCQQHIPYLAQLWYEEISRHWNPNASPEGAHQSLMKHCNRNELPLTLVALQDGYPIGMASLRQNDGIRPDLEPWLGSLVVAPVCRNCGIGEKLIDAIKEKAKSMGFLHLYLLAFDLTIPSWYKNLGWREIGNDQLFGHNVAVMVSNT